MLTEIRRALRSLSKNPGYSIIVLATLALGIGVNVAMFTLLDTLLFKEVPIAEPERLICIESTSPQSQVGNFSYAEFEEMRAQASGPGKAFESITACSNWANAISEPGKTAEQLSSLDGSADFFRTMRVQPILGRAYTAEEEVPGKTQVAVLGYALWQSRFAGDPAAIGRTLRLNAESVTVIGVMPKSFDAPLFFGQVDLWRPITIPRHIVNDRYNKFFAVVGRLNPGVTAAQAKTELEPLTARWLHDYSKSGADRGFALMAPQELQTNSTVRFIVWFMYGLGAAVLAVACANIANLQLARSAAAMKEIAIRSAIGASRARIILQQMVEPIILSVLGGLAGILIATWINHVFGRAILINNIEPIRLELDGRVVVFAMATSLISGVVFGLLPAWYASGADGNALMKQSSRGSSTGTTHNRIRAALTISEIALSVALLGAAGAMVRGLGALIKQDAGWDTSRVVAAEIHLPEQSRYLAEDSRRLAIDKLRQRLEQIPGAESTSVSTSIPMFGYSKESPVQIEGQTYADETKEPQGGFTMVEPSFFATLGIPLIQGTLFRDDLKAGDKPVVLINESMARRFWPKGDAIGKRIGEQQGMDMAWREVIGIVRDVEFPLGVTKPDTMNQIYKPIVNEPWGYLYVTVRGQSPQRFKNELRKAVADVDPDVAVENLYTIPEASDSFNHNLFVISDTLAGFAVLGLLLAVLGLYGVVSYLVSQRSNEIGIRMALGAAQGDILKLILGYGATLTFIGLGVGLVLSVGLNRLLNSAVPGWVGLDLGAIGGTAMILFVVSILACFFPALRATRINPIEAIRTD